MEDGMPGPPAFTAAIFLDDVTPFNGPMIVIPTSHHVELTPAHHESVEQPSDGPSQGGDWETTVSKKLKHRLRRDYLGAEMSRGGLVQATGAAGSVLFFHANLLHSSATNMSACDRKIVFVSYSSVSNKLAPVDAPRPDFLASHQFDALVGLSQYVLTV